MFQLKTEAFGAFEKYTIHDKHQEFSISFVPEHGGCLLSLQLMGEELLDGYQTPQEVDFDRWGKSGVLYPFPNRLDRGQYEWQGKRYQFPINDGATDNALHGFGMDRPLKVQQFKLYAEQAKVQMVGQYDGGLDYYPFSFQFELAFRINTKGIFMVEMALRNTGTQNLPAGLGWHPYFKLSPKIEDTQLLLPPVQMVGINDRMIPTGKHYEYDEFEQRRPIGSTVLDNCFILPQKTVETSVHLWNGSGHLRYWQETGPGKFNYLQLFTPPMRESIAIEPMTCNVDAFNNSDGLANLAPGEELRARAGLVFTKIE